MIWQDLVIVVANVAFAIALIPMIVKTDKPPIGSSLTMAIGLWGIAVALVSSELLFGGIAVGVTAMEWTILFGQRAWEREKG